MRYRTKGKTRDWDLYLDLITHALNWLKENQNYIPDIVLHLRPTQPHRNVKDIDKCLKSTEFTFYYS